MAYGVDTWCTDSLNTSRLARRVNVVIQALYRRLITPRGTLRGGPEERAYGLDVSSYCGAVGDETAIASLPGLVRGVLLKDDRVTDISAAATPVTGSDGLTAIQLNVVGALAEEDQAFQFSVLISATTAELIGGLS